MGLRNHTTVLKAEPSKEELDAADAIIDALHEKHGTVFDD